MFQKLGVPDDLGPVVLLHDEGPEGAVLAGSFGPDGALNIPTLAEDVLHDASVPNLKAVGAGASLLEGNLSLLVPSVGDEFVMVHKSLEGVWQEGSWGTSEESFICSSHISFLRVPIYVEGKLVHDVLCYLFDTISL